MTKKDKLINRFKRLPKDFTFDEMIRLFAGFGFDLEQKGNTSGSRILFINRNEKMRYIMHKPHPGNIIKSYVMKAVKQYLEQNKFI